MGHFLTESFDSETYKGELIDRTYSREIEADELRESEMQPKWVELDFIGWDADNSIFLKPPRWFQCTVNTENHMVGKWGKLTYWKYEKEAKAPWPLLYH